MCRIVSRAAVIAVLCSAAANAQTGKGTFKGTVTDTAGNPLSQADVSFPDLILAARTNDKGAFTFVKLPAGTYHVLVRRVGFAPIDEQIEFADDKLVERKFALIRIVTLDSVVSMSSYRDPGMEEFQEHRQLGLGHFVTRLELQQREGALLSSFLQQTLGLAIIGTHSRDYVTSTHAGHSMCPPTASSTPRGRSNIGSPANSCLESDGIYVPDASEQAMGVPIACYSKVYLDNQLQNPGSPTPPFDLRSVPTNQVEAMEFFSGASQTPQKYQVLNSQCGVLVIHTRRPPQGGASPR
jgi:hypothetical protein